MMEAEKNNKKSYPVGPANSSITIGKGKEESYSWSLSSQDVFSDSGNASGRSQKTSLPSDIERGKRAQLEEDFRKNASRRTKGGRRTLDPHQQRNIKLQAHVTQQEFEDLEQQFQTTKMKYMADFLRLLILDRRKAGYIANKQELLKQLDKMGVQISRIGNNINQIAKYANIQLKSGKIDQRTMGRFNNLMEDYLKEERNLIRAYRALVRNKE